MITAAAVTPSAGRAQALVHYALALLTGVLAVTWYAAEPAGIRYPHTPDSSAYVEAARHVLAGQGLVTSAALGDAAATAPLALFPPGFPLLVAAVSALFDTPPALAAVALSWISWALIPLALLFALAPVLDRRAVHLLAVLVVASPGLAEVGWLALSDTAFLLAVIGSFGFLLRASQAPQQRAPAAMLAAGLLCGVAYVLRNSGTAVFAATIFAFAVLVAARAIALRTALVRLAWWAAGAATMLLPLWARNLAVFGTLQPYRMPASDVGLIENIRSYLQAMLLDLSGAEAIGMLAWDGARLVTLAMLGLAAAWVARPRLRRAWARAGETERLAFVLLAAYAAAGACMVILARTLYQWGEPINLRHVIQYDWALLALAAITLAALRSRPVAVLALAGAVLLAGARWAHNDARLDGERATYAAVTEEADPVQALARQPNRGVMFTNKIRLVVARNRPLMDEIAALPASTVVVSNLHEVLRIETGRSIYPLWIGGECEAARIVREVAAVAGSADLRVLIFPKNELLRSGCWAKLQRDASVSPPASSTPSVVTLGATLSYAPPAAPR